MHLGIDKYAEIIVGFLASGSDASSRLLIPSAHELLYMHT